MILSRYGRKPIFFLSLVIQVVFGILAAYAPEYITFTIARLVIGATTSGVFLVAYVIGNYYLLTVNNNIFIRIYYFSHGNGRTK